MPVDGSAPHKAREAWVVTMDAIQVEIVTQLRSYQYATNIRGEVRSMAGRAADEIDRLRLQVNENAEIADYWRTEAQEARAALKPFAELAGKLDAAPNLVGLLTEADFKRAADAFGAAELPSEDKT